MGLDNVCFVDFQPKERLPEVLAGATSTWSRCAGAGLSSVPSKTYSILAAGRPVLASVDEGTEVARVVERGRGAGGAAGRPRRLHPCRCVTLLDEPERAAAMGRAGRSFVERWASPAAVAERYEALFEELAHRRRSWRARDGPRAGPVPWTCAHDTVGAHG